MKSATLAHTAFVGLLVCLGAVASASMAEAQVPAPQPSTANPAPKSPTVQPQAAPLQPAPSVGRQGSQAKSGDRRRRTYASCNRASHARGLRGGARRRFLIRCKLGYEQRPKTQQNAAPQPLPPPHGRQP